VLEGLRSNRTPPVGLRETESCVGDDEARGLEVSAVFCWSALLSNPRSYMANDMSVTHRKESATVAPCCTRKEGRTLRTLEANR